jgi:prepilin-type N-terminal cleavage/methylation domain-containing protein
MSFKLRRKSKQGYSLVEMIVAIGLFGIVSVAVCTIYLFSTRAFASLANYAELDKINRTAMDTLTKEIRQARLVTDVTTNSVSIINGAGISVTYRFEASSRRFMRFAADGTSKVLVSDCSLLNFDVYQRNNIAGTWDQYPVASHDWSEYVKVIRLTWKAYRPVPGGPGVSENIQTAKIIIRKQN